MSPKQSRSRPSCEKPKSQFCAILIFTRFLPYFRRQKNLTPAGGHVIDFYLSFPSRLIFTRFLPYFRRQKKPVPAGGSAIDYLCVS